MTNTFLDSIIMILLIIFQIIAFNSLECDHKLIEKRIDNIEKTYKEKLCEK